jgi:hypothetical protein
VPKLKSHDPPLDLPFQDLPTKNEKLNSTKKEIRNTLKAWKNDYDIRRLSARNHRLRHFILMIDRVSVAGLSGTLATFGLSSLDSLFGCIAGLVTIVYMSIKVWQEVKKK